MIYPKIHNAIRIGGGTFGSFQGSSASAGNG